MATPDDNREPGLVRLLHADILRDGGSLEAAFETSDGRYYWVFLQRSSFPDAAGLHHRWLFEWLGGPERPEGLPPILTGSPEERAIIRRLEGFLASRAEGSGASPRDERWLPRLQELIRYIPRREPAFPDDIVRES